MPTKRNKADQQQPYVPAGNGDASGEYADHESGSNKHFTNFKKPESQEVIEQPKATENATNEEIKSSDDKESIKENIKNHELLKGKTPRQKYAIYELILRRKRNKGVLDDKDINILASMLWFYGGSYGDFSNESQENIKNLVLDVAKLDNEDFEQTDERVYYKAGRKWDSSYNKGLLDLAGVQNFTKDQMEAEEEKKHQKDISLSKVQQEVENRIRGIGYKGIFSLKGLNDENSKKVGNAIVKTFQDFPLLKDNLISFGTETGIRAQAEEEYRKHINTDEYKIKLDKYKKKLIAWNPNKEITDDYVEKAYKNLYLGAKSKTTSGQFWGACGTDSMNGRKSWIQIKNTKYSKYKEENERSIQRNGYPNNIGADFDATTYHELGHAICNFVLGASAFGEYVDFKTTNQIRDIKKKYGKPISSYGRTNIHEYIAECFAAHYTQQGNAQADEVFNVVMNRYKELYK